MKNCEICNKEINEKEYTENNQLCRKCFKEEMKCDDEEVEKVIKKAYKEIEIEEEKEEQYYIPKSNLVAVAVNFIAILTMIGGVAGALITESFLFFLYTFIVAIFICVFAEIVNLLQKILYMLDKIYKKGA